MPRILPFQKQSPAHSASQPHQVPLMLVPKGLRPPHPHSISLRQAGLQLNSPVPPENHQNCPLRDRDGVLGLQSAHLDLTEKLGSMHDAVYDSLNHGEQDGWGSTQCDRKELPGPTHLYPAFCKLAPPPGVEHSPCRV